jgi:drug/metabolite transporter (DMT)-like permease
MWFGMCCAVVSAICYGAGSAAQAAAARTTGDSGGGVDPRLLIRLLGQWRYLVGLGLDVLGLVAQVTALRVLPLFLAQAAMSASIAVTALLATRWFGVRLSHREWLSVAGVCAGLALLGAAAAGQGAGHGTPAIHAALLVFAVLLAVLGIAAGQLGEPARTATLGLISGLGYGVLGVAARVLPSLAPTALIRDPAVYAAIVAGILASWFYAAALQRGGVVAATATMLIGETVPPSAIGVLLLGDHTRPGWTPPAVAGFAIAVTGALVLARFGEITPPREPNAEPVGVGSERQ